MSKRRHKIVADVPAAVMVEILKTRASVRSAERHHKLNFWQAAKKKHGKGALKAMCTSCGRVVILLPHGPAGDSAMRGTPSMRGPAIFEEC